jgi:hypothetical protein
VNYCKISNSRQQTGLRPEGGDSEGQTGNPPEGWDSEGETGNPPAGWESEGQITRFQVSGKKNKKLKPEH